MIKIQFLPDRTKVGQLALVDNNGNIIFGPVAAFGKADNKKAADNNNPSRDPKKLYGDTPTGTYKSSVDSINLPLKTYGPYKTIKLEPISGDALVAKNNGRSGILIHGGAAGSGNKLRPTYGCVRVYNDDMKLLLNAIASGSSLGAKCVIETVSNLFMPVETSDETLSEELYPDTDSPDELVMSTSPFSIDTDLKLIKSPLTELDIRLFFASRKPFQQGLADISQAAISTSQKYEINATYIVAHAILESAWGTSTIAKVKNNLFGYGAYDHKPLPSAVEFATRAECIDKVMALIDKNYLSKTGKYYEKSACLGDKSHGMNVHYATDPNWGKNIATIARQIERFARR